MTDQPEIPPPSLLPLLEWEEIDLRLAYLRDAGLPAHAVRAWAGTGHKRSKEGQIKVSRFFWIWERGGFSVHRSPAGLTYIKRKPMTSATPVLQTKGRPRVDLTNPTAVLWG